MNYSIPQHGVSSSGNRTRIIGEIDLLDYWRVVCKYRWMIAGIVVIVSIAAVIISLTMTNYFKASATLLPVSSKSGMPSVISQLGGLASLAGVSVPGGMTDNVKFLAILNSRTLAENIIRRESLMPVFFPKNWDTKTEKWKTDDPKKRPTIGMAVAALKGSMLIEDDKKTKIIRISGIFTDPVLSARVTNAYIDELQDFISKNSFTMAKRNRIFVESQLENNQLELLEASKEINDFYRGNRVSSAESKLDVQIGKNSKSDDMAPPDTINENMDVREGAVVKNPELWASNSEVLSALSSQKADIEKKITGARVVKNVPQQVYLTYLMLRRELLGKVNALLTTQYEMAKIEEAKEDLAFQVIDRAVPPEMKFKPKRSQICIMSFTVALFAAVFLAFLCEHLSRMKSQN